ncbi:MAG: RsmB/NOP family class I SAM-dependent RNA methyltransferase [Planctomycetota bacterium]
MTGRPGPGRQDPGRQGQGRQGQGKGKGRQGQGQGRQGGGGQRGPDGGGRGPNLGGRGPRQRRPEVREVAGRIVRGVLGGRGAARSLVERALEGDELRPGDEALLTELVYGTVRQAATLDRLLEASAPRGLGKVEEALLNHLRVAAYQLVFSERVHAAVAVDAAVRAAGRWAHVRGFVNGLLRGLSRAVLERRPEDALPADVPRTRLLPGRDGGWVVLGRDLLPAEPEAWLAAAGSLPPGLAREWTARHGPEGALELARAANAPPPTALRVNPLRAGGDLVAARAEVLARLEGARAGEGPAAVVLAGGLGDVGRELLWGGWVTVQDETAQLVAPLLDPQPGERVVDLCAAPGGKATHLAELMRDQGRVEALDVDEDRLARVSAAARRLRLESVHTTLVPALDPRPPEGAPIDRVLADVPCSNTGVLRRRVEVRWRLDQLDWPPLLALQARLLDRALELVRPGGAVVYSTCSIDPRENEQQVQSALARHPGVRLEAELATLPRRGGGDGGYAAKLIKPAGGVTAPTA